jgi:hypothetical protein
VGGGLTVGKMQDLADHQARQLVQALKALGLDGVAVRGRAYLPSGVRAYRETPWGQHWRLMLTVRWGGQEVSVEHLDDTAFRSEITAKTVSRIFAGAYSDERYRCDRLGDHEPQRYAEIVAHFIGRSA